MTSTKPWVFGLFLELYRHAHGSGCVIDATRRELFIERK
jgi:hypothetical protein